MSRGLGDVYKRQTKFLPAAAFDDAHEVYDGDHDHDETDLFGKVMNKSVYLP